MHCLRRAAWAGLRRRGGPRGAGMGQLAAARWPPPAPARGAAGGGAAGLRGCSSSVTAAQGADTSETARAGTAARLRDLAAAAEPLSRESALEGAALWRTHGTDLVASNSRAAFRTLSAVVRSEHPSLAEKHAALQPLADALPELAAGRGTPSPRWVRGAAAVSAHILRTASAAESAPLLEACARHALALASRRDWWRVSAAVVDVGVREAHADARARVQASLARARLQRRSAHALSLQRSYVRERQREWVWRARGQWHAFRNPDETPPDPASLASARRALMRRRGRAAAAAAARSRTDALLAHFPHLQSRSAFAVRHAAALRARDPLPSPGLAPVPPGPHYPTHRVWGDDEDVPLLAPEQRGAGRGGTGGAAQAEHRDAASAVDAAHLLALAHTQRRTAMLRARALNAMDWHFWGTEEAVQGTPRRPLPPALDAVASLVRAPVVKPPQAREVRRADLPSASAAYVGMLVGDRPPASTVCTRAAPPHHERELRQALRRLETRPRAEEGEGEDERAASARIVAATDRALRAACSAADEVLSHAPALAVGPARGVIVRSWLTRGPVPAGDGATGGSSSSSGLLPLPTWAHVALSLGSHAASVATQAHGTRVLDQLLGWCSGQLAAEGDDPTPHPSAGPATDSDSPRDLAFDVLTLAARSYRDAVRCRTYPRRPF